jgi:hypothetical protein
MHLKVIGYGLGELSPGERTVVSSCKHYKEVLDFVDGKGFFD